MYISPESEKTGYLLDTHTFLWSISDPSKLSVKVRNIIEDENNPVFISSITFWEIAIKEKIGKISISGINSLLLPNIAKEYNYSILNPDAYDFITSKELPLKKDHKDPFDRMLIHLAVRKNLIILSKDQFFPLYKDEGLQLLW